VLNYLAANSVTIVDYFSLSHASGLSQSRSALALFSPLLSCFKMLTNICALIKLSASKISTSS